MVIFSKIAIACDHAGFELKGVVKSFLAELGVEVSDMGTNDKTSVDYPDFAALCAKEVLSKKCEAGILICGSGIGMSIAANRFKGIRAALCHDLFTAEMCRKHNNANIIVMGANVVSEEMAKKMIETWLNTDFEGGRHERRIMKLDNN